ncbi:MAG: hypothetical protein ABI165_13255 [Bryobacteraceae bacterium]
MNCDDVRARLAEYWSGEIDDTEFVAHLDGCETCRREAELLGEIWANLGLLPAEQPGREMRARFYETLEAYRQGMAAGRWRWWPKHPALQFAASMALLILGLGTGYAVRGPGARDTGEVDSMRQLVALSLLRQSSPVERLKGVDWSYRVPQSDTEVLAALLYTINHDENVNVRLAAVDALHYFADSPVARKGLLQAIPKQTSPLVEIALIDLTADLQDAQSRPALESLAQSADTSPEVKQRVQWALEKLK